VKFRSIAEAINTETPKAAQKRGVKFGRRPKLSPLQVDHARGLVEGLEDRQKVAALAKVGRKTLHRALAVSE
jgi:hypothetical protein